MKRAVVGLLVVIAGLLTVNLLPATPGVADVDIVMGDIACVAERLGIECGPQGYDLSEILHAVIALIPGAPKRPCVSTLLINEVEMNPPSEDSGAEWVELFNQSFHEVSLAGWRISYTSYCDAPCECWEPLPSDVTILPGEYYVFTFGKRRLHNEKGWAICLEDAPGTTVDATPEGLTDTYNDNQTWQRYPSGKWVFRYSTKEGPNS